MRHAINMMHTIKQLVNKISFDEFSRQARSFDGFGALPGQLHTCHISVPLVTALGKEKNWQILHLA